jgi:hypothetical protein
MARAKRIAKIVGPIRVAVSLLVGTLLTVLVAWWIALSPAFLPEFPFSRRPPHPSPRYANQPNPEARYYIFPETDRLQVIFVADHGNHINAGSAWYTPEQWADSKESPIMPAVPVEPNDEVPLWIGGLWRAYDRHPGFPIFWYNEFGYGWPLTTLVARQVRDGQAVNVWEGTWQLPVIWQNSIGAQSRYVPLSPAFPGFYLTALVLASATYALLSVPASVSGVRRRLTNRCPACGYSLEGLTAPECPECGKTVRTR